MTGTTHNRKSQVTHNTSHSYPHTNWYTDNCGWYLICGENSQNLVFGETEALLDYFGGGLDRYWIRFGEEWITTGLHALRPNWSYIFTIPVSFTLSG